MNIDDLLNDREKLFEILNNENDLGLVLISVNFLEQWLVLLLEKRFIDDPSMIKEVFDPSGLLCDFSKKVKLSYCLGIIDKKVMKDLKEIAKIRNQFAHSHQLLTFRDKKIQDGCKKLKSGENSMAPWYDENNKDDIPKIAKSRFSHTVVNILAEIESGEILERIFTGSIEKKS